MRTAPNRHKSFFQILMNDDIHFSVVPKNNDTDVNAARY